ncbi:MAG TPA: peptidylprolyl isomerase [Bacteroidales bacterium]|nr:MAG: hypothetical protein A2X11_10295 [Bacteroidetes bacterium GWE2_42_24]OFY32594.1 MAG: hypothetical protein A2X09_02350 [Bacteroidetes bacterium GWF2_43_11]HBZ65577.1 peptidylprolyl isomerase [Bacteroidales bacterium]
MNLSVSFTTTLLCLILTFLKPAAAQQAAYTRQVIITTIYGDIVIGLYDLTPLHRDNFVRQVTAGWFDGSDFHRVISNFVVQGGGGRNGEEDPGYTIPAEVTPRLCHLRGAVGMARESDNVNPSRASSSSQFYIIHGKPVTDSTLNLQEKRLGYSYLPNQRSNYLLQGGQPRLDGLYTIFGEVISGMNVVDSIAARPTGAEDRPLEKIIINAKLINN